MVDLLGTAAVIRAALPYLERSTRGGKVVTIASTLGVKAVCDGTAYCASKFGVVGFTQPVGCEGEGDGGVPLDGVVLAVGPVGRAGWLAKCSLEERSRHVPEGRS